MSAIARFRRMIWSHYRSSGRRLPWRETRDPYAILVSEYMLQQTHVDRVIPKYRSFLQKFPDMTSLAAAPLSDVLREWQGLGYNRRALWLHRLAGEVRERYGGRLPQDPDILKTLPGIGPGTAGAIAAFAFQHPSVFIETNIRRACIHFFFPRARRVDDRQLMPLIAAAVSRKNPREWYYALMDYGAMLGRSRERPNPNRRSRHYSVQPKFEGSNRQIRGRILRVTLADPTLTVPDIAKKLGLSLAGIRPLYDALKREGLIA